MKKIISDNMEQIKTLCQAHHVETLFSFGSVETEKFNENTSDIDLLVSFKPMNSVDYAENYFSMAEDLEILFHKPVDLITERTLSNPYFIQTINKTKTLIYGY